MMQFQLGTIAPKVKHSLERMHKFFMTTYAGVGCSVCNAETHKLVDAGKKTITVGENFCRDLTSNSLHVLLYLHIHYIKFYQLSSKFMAQCDHLGNYDEAASVPAEAAIKIDEGMEGELMACREFRNDNSWLASCGSICEDFNLTKIEETFYPHINAFIAGAKFLGERHKAIVAASTPAEKEEVKEAEKEAGTDKKPGDDKAKGDDKAAGDDNAKKDETKPEAGKEERILERIKFRRDVRVLEGETTAKAEGTSDPKPEGDKAATPDPNAAPAEPPVPTITLPSTPEEKFADAVVGDVFPQLEKAPEMVAGLKPVFATPGANPYKDGQMANLTLEVYDKIEKELDEAAKKAAAENKGGDQSVEKVNSSSWFLGASRYSVQSLMVMLAAFMFVF